MVFSIGVVQRSVSISSLCALMLKRVNIERILKSLIFIYSSCLKLNSLKFTILYVLNLFSFRGIVNEISFPNLSKIIF